MAAADLPEEPRLTPKGRATRERIVKVAAELILAQGVSALNMETVRRTASVSGSQLGHYFADKQALIRAVLVRQIDVVLDFHRRPGLHALESFGDFERWIDLNMRYLRSIGYTGTPTYHALAGRLVKSSDATRQTIAAGYWKWVGLLEESLRAMKTRGILVAEADPRRLALVIVSAHQGGGVLTDTYRQEWPHANAIRFAVNYLRLFATDPAQRVPHPPRRGQAPRTTPTRTHRSEGADSPFTRKGLATRTHIVTTAADLMFRHGVTGTSMEDLRAAASVSGSQLAHYFADKDDLTRRVIALRGDNVVAFHTRPNLGRLDSLEALHAWADACVADADAVYRRGGCVYGSLAGELLESGDETLDDLAGGYERWIGLFRAGLTELQERGGLRAEADPHHLAVALVAAHQGGAMITYATDSSEPVDAAVNAAVEYVSSFAPQVRRRVSRTARRNTNS